MVSLPLPKLALIATLRANAPPKLPIVGRRRHHRHAAARAGALVPLARNPRAFRDIVSTPKAVLADRNQFPPATKEHTVQNWISHLARREGLATMVAQARVHTAVDVANLVTALRYIPRNISCTCNITRLVFFVDHGLSLHHHAGTGRRNVRNGPAISKKSLRAQLRNAFCLGTF
jgi:hypothetical protein